MCSNRELWRNRCSTGIDVWPVSQHLSESADPVRQDPIRISSSFDCGEQMCEEEITTSAVLRLRSNAVRKHRVGMLARLAYQTLKRKALGKTCNSPPSLMPAADDLHRVAPRRNLTSAVGFRVSQFAGSISLGDLTDAGRPRDSFGT